MQDKANVDGVTDKARSTSGDRSAPAAEALPTADGTAASDEPAKLVTQPETLDAAQLHKSLGELRAELKQAREEARQARHAAQRAQGEFAAGKEQIKRQISAREERLYASLAQLGVDAKDVESLRETNARESELQDLREQLHLSNAERLQAGARFQRDEIVRRECAELGVDPNDQRLDLSSPPAFFKSLARIAREDGKTKGLAEKGNAGEPTAEEKGRRSAVSGQRSEESEDEDVQKRKPLRSARDDLDVLGSGSGGRVPEEMNFKSPSDAYDSEWSDHRARLGRRK